MRENGIGGPPPVPFGMLGSVTHLKETAMSALTVSQDPEQSWDDLVRFWEEMEWPEGSKVEIIEGIITVSPAPAYRHNVIAARIQRRLYSVIQAPGSLRSRHRHQRVPRDLSHPSSVATTTRTGTDNTVDTRIESLASRSPTP
jgi:hypothetical protein